MRKVDVSSLVELKVQDSKVAPFQHCKTRLVRRDSTAEKQNNRYLEVPNSANDSPINKKRISMREKTQVHTPGIRREFSVEDGLPKLPLQDSIKLME